MSDNSSANPTNKDTSGDKGGDKDKGGKGAEPIKKTDASEFESSSISDTDFDKIFEDPRLFKHSRFKKLNAKAKKVDELEQIAKDKKEADLVENKKFEELAEDRKTELETLQGEVKSAKINNAIQLEAVKQGTVDVESVR